MTFSKSAISVRYQICTGGLFLHARLCKSIFTVFSNPTVPSPPAENRKSVEPLIYLNFGKIFWGFRSQTPYILEFHGIYTSIVDMICYLLLIKWGKNHQKWTIFICWPLWKKAKNHRKVDKNHMLTLIEKSQKSSHKWRIFICWLLSKKNWKSPKTWNIFIWYPLSEAAVNRQKWRNYVCWPLSKKMKKYQKWIFWRAPMASGKIIKNKEFSYANPYWTGIKIVQKKWRIIKKDFGRAKSIRCVNFLIKTPKKNFLKMIIIKTSHEKCKKQEWPLWKETISTKRKDISSKTTT